MSRRTRSRLVRVSAGDARTRASCAPRRTSGTSTGARWARRSTSRSRGGPARPGPRRPRPARDGRRPRAGYSGHAWTPHTAYRSPGRGRAGCRRRRSSPHADAADAWRKTAWLAPFLSSSVSVSCLRPGRVTRHALTPPAWRHGRRHAGGRHAAYASLWACSSGWCLVSCAAVLQMPPWVMPHPPRPACGPAPAPGVSPGSGVGRASACPLYTPAPVHTGGWRSSQSTAGDAAAGTTSTSPRPAPTGGGGACRRASPGAGARRSAPAWRRCSTPHRRGGQPSARPHTPRSRRSCLPLPRPHHAPPGVLLALHRSSLLGAPAFRPEGKARLPVRAIPRWRDANSP